MAITIAEFIISYLLHHKKIGLEGIMGYRISNERQILIDYQRGSCGIFTGCRIDIFTITNLMII
jgi:hypothetical protein